MTKEQYLKGKAKIIGEALDWEREFPERDWSWEELAEVGNYFYKMGKRYGLLREFHENGIC